MTEKMADRTIDIEAYLKSQREEIAGRRKPNVKPTEVTFDTGVYGINYKKTAGFEMKGAGHPDIHLTARPPKKPTAIEYPREEET